MPAGELAGLPSGLEDRRGFVRLKPHAPSVVTAPGGNSNRAQGRFERGFTAYFVFQRRVGGFRHDLKSCPCKAGKGNCRSLGSPSLCSGSLGMTGQGSGVGDQRGSC